MLLVDAEHGRQLAIGKAKPVLAFPELHMCPRIAHGSSIIRFAGKLNRRAAVEQVHGGFTEDRVVKRSRDPTPPMRPAQDFPSRKSTDVTAGA